jgi:4-diphosphocytidyl-2-C-methyl-D-erythritol kinase
MTSWTTIAAAKLNLTLEVIGKRDDAFHDLASIAVSLDLADELRITLGGDQRSISYRDDRGRPVSIQTSDDIVARAWTALAARCPLPSNASIEVVKRIPIVSGLGGGSTDAAAFLRLARHAWQLNLSDQELCEIGGQVGSDVPVCLTGGLVEMAGRGDIVRPVSEVAKSPNQWTVLLHRAEIPVPANKTATMYRSLRSSDFRSGASTEAMLANLLAGTAPVQDDCVNSFDRLAREVMQGLTPAWRNMGVAIARASSELKMEPVTPMLAGAGPTLFAILEPGLADLAAELLRKYGGQTFVARPFGRAEATAVQAL